METKRVKVVAKVTEQPTLMWQKGNIISKSAEVTTLGFKPIHLYFLAEEKISMGDWYYWVNNEQICEARHEIQVLNEHLEANHVYKIIATTDPSLRHDVEVDALDNNGVAWGTQTKNKMLPRPSDAFIDKYCQVNGISEVLVEYESIGTNEDQLEVPIDYSQVEEIFVLKVDNHNTITVHPVKDSYSRDEVMNFGLWLGEEFKKQNYSFPRKKPRSIDSLLKEWENL